MKVKTIKVSDIVPYPNNPRQNDAAVAKVRESIERFGYQTPIVVDRKNIVIAGHTRLAAVKELGWEQVEVIVANLPKALANEFRIVENRTAELAEWDKDRLIDELRAIDDGLEIQAFFKDGEINRLFASMAVSLPGQAEIDKAAEDAATKFKDAADQAAAELAPVICKACKKTFCVR